MTEKTISFVIPAYNEENYIARCLDAILRETVRYDAEVIVVDNNSTDRTAEIVSRYPNVKLVREMRRGANRTRETGFATSRGGLVAFLDADTEMPHRWMKRALQEFKKDNRLVCLSGPFIYYDLPLWVRAFVRIFYLLAYLIYIIGRVFFRRTTTVQGGNYIVRRWALQKIGGHNVDITFYGDDTDLAMRLSKVGRVKFSFGLPILSSGRRLAKEGAFTMGLRYTMNNLWMVLFRHPFTATSKEIRFGKDGTVYQPEHKWKERFVAIGFSAVVLLVFGALIYVAYLVIALGYPWFAKLLSMAPNVLKE